MSKISEFAQRFPLQNNEWLAVADTGTATTYKTLPAHVGGIPLLASGAMTDPTDIDITAYTAYGCLKLFVDGVTIDTDNTSLALQFSDDGGGTFENDAADYEIVSTLHYNGSSVFTSDSTGTTNMTICGSIGNGAGECMSAEIMFYRPHDAVLFSHVAMKAMNYDSGVSVWKLTDSAASFLQTDDVTDIRIFASNVIDGGSYALYGIRTLP